MRLYLYVLACVIKYPNILLYKFKQIDLLYQGTLFNQSQWLFLSISYFISWFVLVIHNIPTWSNIGFNTKLVIISSNVVFFKNIPVSLLQLIHLIDMTSDFSSSQFKRYSNMANTFIRPIFFSIIFAVFSIMTRKGNHRIVSLIDVVQKSSPSTQLNSLFKEGSYRLVPIFIS